MKKEIKQTHNQNHPDLGDPMTQMFFDMIKIMGSYGAKYPTELNEERMWQMIRKNP